MIGILIFLIFIILIILGLPIAFSMILTSLLSVLFFGGGVEALIISFNQLSAGFTFPFIAVFFFVFLGELMTETKISDYLIDFLRKLIGKLFKLEGRTGGIMILSCAATGTLTGSAIATTTAVGGILAPQMEKLNYDKKYITILLSYSGILGTLIPPSITGLVYAVIVDLPVLTVWLAVGGVGILYTIVQLIVNYIVSKRRKYEVYDNTKDFISFHDLIKSFFITMPAILVPICVLGSIYAGIATPTESGAIGVLATIIIGVFYYKTLFSIKQIRQALYKSACQTAVIMILLCTSFSLAHVLTSTGILKSVTRSMLLLTDNKYILLLLIELLLLFLGCFMDDAPIKVLLAPLVTAILVPIGINPIHLAAIFCFTCIVGMVTPPVGIVLYAAMSVVGTKMSDIFFDTFKFLLPALLVLLIVTFFPAIALFLPKIFGLL